MSLTQLRTPFLENGIRSTNFFNGRLLSGEDMTTEHNATIQRLSCLGKSLGHGVAHGLEVCVKHPGPGETRDEKADPVLTVTAGLAINQCGETVQLTSDVNVRLARPAGSVTNGIIAGAFGCCVPPATGGRRVGDGVYLLTIAPASGREGRAPVNGLGADSAKCNSKYLVEGAQFNLVRIAEPFLTEDDFSTAKLPRLRNKIAYKCFGTEELAALPRDPFGARLEKYGLVDALLDSGALTRCEVPLAITYWTLADGIVFVDLWAVRRQLVHWPSPKGWLAELPGRTIAEGEARLMQFQRQVEDLRAAGSTLSSLTAQATFDYLPPLGFVPFSDPSSSANMSLTFFTGMPVRDPIFVESGLLPALMRHSLAVSALRTDEKLFLWLYRIRENEQASRSLGPRRIQTYLVFASPLLPFIGDARYDFSRWDFSNYVTLFAH